MISSLKSAVGGKLALPSLPPALRNNLPLMLGLAVALTAAIMMYLWQDQSSYKPVFGAREKVAAADMMTVLEAEQIPYRVHPDSGQVMVPASALGKVRMLLAAKGVTAQLPAGLELMDRSDPLGVSQFVQDVRFRRGLEGELAQSILTMDAIASARVHLAIAKTSSFVTANTDGNSASVMVSVKPGRALSNEQVAAVVNLVSGSVAGLKPQRVSLVDQAGNLLSARVDLADGFEGATQGDAASRRYTDEVRANVNDLLAPILGVDNYKLSVTAAVDNDRIEETQEKYGEAPKVTSEAMREEMEKNRMALGVPGTLSNRPPVPATPGAEGDAPQENNDDGSARKNATTRQYAYDRAITQIKRERGRLKKLSVAVVLNNASAANGQAWTPAELANIEKILAGGLGIDAARGDVLAVSSLKFPAAPVAQEWWQERDNVVDMTTYALWALGALLAYFLLARPLLRAVTTRLAPQQPPLAPATPALPGSGAAAADAADAAPAGVAALGAPDGVATAARPGAVVPLLENYDLPPSGSAVDVMVDHLKVLAGKEPERVAEVVKQWVQKKHGRPE
ncbi:flagellar basal-body MS-ring/collar protein FliF [Massilia sp. CFBP9012]|uniref:flagellar basal-body MS-ring/collar protein FliF n=1 Tax=Massilia sp. CFBP9012 TaxID=3096531 RepID=UPI002A6A2533|nr:flagellar basal-body MS-ring/collar protein FliF [Massilia sp. CFBP9012]MDY0974736.1 flagellar basal-body MS-ring/collar protein FliF [Massilia sp. CFBP9012]